VLVQCCVCKKVLFDGQWREMPLPSVGHQVWNGYCSQCYEAVIARAHEKQVSAQVASALALALAS
jgi:hypothetical protein